MRNIFVKLNENKSNISSPKRRCLNKRPMPMVILATGVMKSLISTVLAFRLTMKRRESRLCHFASRQWHRLNPTPTPRSTLSVEDLARLAISAEGLVSALEPGQMSKHTALGLQLPVLAVLQVPLALHCLQWLHLRLPMGVA